MTEKSMLAFLLVVAGSLALAGFLAAEEVCTGFGPQTPRDLESYEGTNPVTFARAPNARRMNLCNIHFHRHAEHKGPGFSDAVEAEGEEGFRCQETGDLTASERTPLGENHCKNIQAGDTIEVHWVYSTCDVEPGEGLGACSLEGVCVNPQLRVEAQVFLLVNDAEATSFADFIAQDEPVRGFHQPRALPDGTGRPVEYLGSTTGPSFSDTACSPLQVSWSVRPQCKKLGIASLSAWCKDDFEEGAQAGRRLVTDKALLSRIDP